MVTEAATDVKMAKQALRKSMAVKLKLLSMELIEKQSERVLKQLCDLPVYRDAKSISVFISFAREINTRPIIEDAFSKGKQVYVPRFRPKTNQMDMLRVEDMTDLDGLPAIQPWNIRQPSLEDDSRENAITTGGLDLLILPGCAFTPCGRRLGHGVGYYDTFQTVHADKIRNRVALALREQIVDDVPTTDLDVTVPMKATKPTEYTPPSSDVIVRMLSTRLSAQVAAVAFVVHIFISSLLGSIFVYFPTMLILLLISRPLYRSVSDKIIGFWLILPVVYLRLVFGVRIRYSGHPIESSHKAIYIMNHRTRLDWMFFWYCLFCNNPWLLTTEKIVLKSPLKNIPGAGWAMQCGGYIFISRNWKEDEQIFNDVIAFYKSMDSPYQILLFPEGTDRCKNAIGRSHSYAESHGLQKYEYVLHPKTKGFSHLVDRMRSHYGLDAVYNITVGYPDVIVANEFELAGGNIPQAVCFNVQRVDNQNVPPTSDLDTWLRKLWADKETQLEQFYRDRCFSDESDYSELPLRSTVLLYVCLTFWTVTLVIWSYFLLFVWWVQLYSVVVVVSYFGMRHMFGGVEQMEIKMSQ